MIKVRSACKSGYPSLSLETSSSISKCSGSSTVIDLSFSQCSIKPSLTVPYSSSESTLLLQEELDESEEEEDEDEDEDDPFFFFYFLNLVCITLS